MEIHEFIHSVERLRGDLLRQARRLLDSEDDAEDAVQETLTELSQVKYSFIKRLIYTFDRVYGT